MKTTVSTKKVKRWMTVVTIFLGLCGSTYFVVPVAGGRVMNSSVACRVEIDRDVLPEGGPRYASVGLLPARSTGESRKDPRAVRIGRSEGTVLDPS